MSEIKNGGGYCRNIPKHRILNTLIKFDAAIIFFLIYRYIVGINYSMKVIVLSFLGWESVGNSNWYIFSILWLYLFTYIAFSVFKEPKKALGALLALTVVYMGVVSIYKANWWYDTVLCYVLGMWFSCYRPQIEQVVDENKKTWLFSWMTAAGLFAVCYFHCQDSIVIYQTMILTFTLAVLFATIHIQIKNKILEWCGKNLFELYILQRLPMLILKDAGLCDWNRYVFVGACLVLTVILACVFKYTISKRITL